MGPDQNLKYITTFLVLFQIVSCYYISQLSMGWILFFAYFLGGVINHSLTLAIHETSHNLAFGHYYPMTNRLFSLFANLPIGVPMAIAFKKYHLIHHRFLGEDGTDTDIASRIEALFFKNTFLKVIWMILQPIFYSLRPGLVKPMAPTGLEILNYIVQFTFDGVMVYICGYKALVYFIGGTLLSMGLHPMAGHFISEHYMFDRGYETYSYYGILNLLTFNVGYHMEHHDFPYIPGSRLPEVKRIASEFYDSLPQHSSWVKVIWDFLMRTDIGPYARICRDPDHFGKLRTENPYFDVPAPSVEPFKKINMVGIKVNGPEEDWKNVLTTCNGLIKSD